MPAIVSPPVPSSIATGEAVQLDIFVDSSTWEGQFDSLELWRSRLSQGGPYEAMMGDEWSPARIPAIEGEPPAIPQSGPSANLVGKNVKFLVHEETAVEIVFTGTNPLTFGQAATQIAAGSSGLLTAFVLDSDLIVETVQPGTGAILRVVGGDAAPLLKLPTVEPSSVALGLDARIALNTDVSSYSFTDRNGAREYFYKARFHNSFDTTFSEFGPPFTGKFVAGVSPSNLVRGFIDFVDVNGVAKANQEVLIYSRLDGTILEGKVVVPSGPTRILSDENGHVEVMLVRGTLIAVAIAGTDLVRDIVVPSDCAVTSFNLLDPTKGANDLFKVQIPHVDYATRRSL